MRYDRPHRLVCQLRGCVAGPLAVPAAAACLWILSQACRADDALAQPAEAAQVPWSIHEQATWIDQAHPSFPSPYEGLNSFTAAAESERTFSFSLFAGLRLFQETEVYYNPELLQGHALSNTVGIAGFPNGEGAKAAFPNLHYSTSRLFIRQTIELGGEKSRVEDDQNQVSRSYDENRLTLSLGKFAAGDFFDGNNYSHDSRTQFMNWAILESGAWDYPADEIGYTAGFVAEWITKNWALHYGVFMEPTESNGPVLDKHILDAHGQILQFDRTYTAGSRSGTLRPFVFWNQAHMGNYDDALANPNIAQALTQSRAYRSKVGFGVSWDQVLTETIGAFARLSWDDGRTESFAFTEIDRSLAVGLSANGAQWGRKDDILGVAGVINAIVPAHQAYLAAGGTEGLILGDGALRYGPEEIVEAYYNVQFMKWLSVAPDFQLAVHPGYNRDRGPVPIYAIRAHIGF